MIDLHCHVLPGVDDGALDLEDSVRMAAQARADGIVAICATPHIRHDHDVAIHRIADRVAALQEELDIRGAGVRILPGGEVAESAVDGLADDELAAVSLGGGGRWILLEPQPGPLSPNLPVVVDELARRGYRTLVAHPERHLGDGSVARLVEMVRAGALVQVTAALVRVPEVLALADLGLVHVLGSDAHSSYAGRTVQLTAGLAALRSSPRVAAHLDWVEHTAPVAIVAGEDTAAPYAAG